MMLPPLAGALLGRGYRPVPIVNLPTVALMWPRRRAVLSTYIAVLPALNALAAPSLSTPGFQKYPPSTPAFHQSRITLAFSSLKVTFVARLSRPLPLSV